MILAHKYSNGLEKEPRNEHIPTVDLSGDDKETVEPNRAPQFRSNRNFDFRKTYTDFSGDENYSAQQDSSRLFSPTVKHEMGNNKFKTPDSHRINSTSSKCSPLAPVNSLKHRQQSLSCLHADAITSIVQKYEENLKLKDSQIQNAEEA